MGIYERLGVKRIVNGQAQFTRIGGSIMARDVLEAMAEAAQSFVSIAELNENVGKVIAGYTNAEAAYVCSGAAGGLVLSAAACIAGCEPKKIQMLPDTDGIPNEIIVQTVQITSYYQALRAAGAKLVQIGGADGATKAEFEKAIGRNTVAIAYGPITHRVKWNTGLPLEDVVAIGHDRNLPIIVDASANLPPVDNLTYFISTGADLVTFSGGKAIAGPAGTGILCGRRDLIEAAALNSNPNDSIGRQMKVGKEEIVGLLVALENFVNRDHAADRLKWEAMCEYIADGIRGIPGVKAEQTFWGKLGVPCTRIEVDELALGMSLEEIHERLRSGDPPVHLWDRYGQFRVVPSTLQDGEEEIVIRALKTILSGAQTKRA